MADSTPLFRFVQTAHDERERQLRELETIPLVSEQSSETEMPDSKFFSRLVRRTDGVYDATGFTERVLCVL
jgi:hypothetical protein